MQYDYAKHDDMASFNYSNTGGVTAFPPKRNLAPRFHEAKEAKNKTYIYRVAKKSGKLSARKSSDSQVASSSEC